MSYKERKRNKEIRTKEEWHCQPSFVGHAVIYDDRNLVQTGLSSRNCDMSRGRARNSLSSLGDITTLTNVSVLVI